MDDLVNTPTACYHRRVLPSKLNKIPGDRMTPLTHHKYGVVAVKKWVQGTEILMVALCQKEGLGLGQAPPLCKKHQGEAVEVHVIFRQWRLWFYSQWGSRRHGNLSASSEASGVSRQQTH